MPSKDQIAGILLFSLGALLLFYRKLYSLLLNPYYVVVLILSILILLLVLYYKKTLKIKIENLDIKNNITLVKINDKIYYILAFKVNVKLDPNREKVYTFKNYLLLIKTIEKSTNKNLRVLLINNIYPKPGAYIVVFKLKESEEDVNEIVEFSSQLKTIIEGLEDGLELVPTKIRGEYVTVPTEMGAVVFPTVLGSSIKVPAPPYFYETERVNVIELGQTHEGRPVGITEDELVRHIAIFGATGSGKTNTSAQLASQVAQKGYTVIILDWYGEYSQYLRDFLRLHGNLPAINPLGIAKVEELTDLLGQALDLTEPQKFLLYLVLMRLKSLGRFDLQLLLDVVKELEDSSSWMRDVKYALIRKLILMFSEEGSRLFNSNGRGVEELGNLLEDKRVIIDLSTIESETLRRLYGLFVLLFFAHYKMKKKNNKKSLIIIDEAQNYFVENKNIVIDRILREYRKFGISLCLVTQSPSAVSDDVLKNTSVKIIHSIKSNLDKRILSESTALPKELSDYLDKLDPGEAICSCSSEKLPLLIRIKKTN